MERSCDSLTSNGSHAPLGKQSPDKSRDQARSPVPTPSRGDARHVYKAKEIHKTDLASGVIQTDMAKDRPWEDSHKCSMDSHGRERIPVELRLAS